MSAENKSYNGPGRRAAVSIRRFAGTRAPARARIAAAVRAALGGRAAGQLSVAVVDDRRIAALHERFMGDDRPTDVLTFDLRDDPEADVIEGEIVVSADTARREARRRGLSPDEELLRYVIHGVLHLCGLDDHTPAERRRMRREENRVLGRLAGGPAPAGRRKRG